MTCSSRHNLGWTLQRTQSKQHLQGAVAGGYYIATAAAAAAASNVPGLYAAKTVVRQVLLEPYKQVLLEPYKLHSAAASHVVVKVPASRDVGT
jgi:hypothetical protein